MIKTCTWIEPKGESLRMCCTHQVVEGRNYCEEHLWRVYSRGTALRKRHKEIKQANDVWDWESVVNEIVTDLAEEEV